MSNPSSFTRYSASMRFSTRFWSPLENLDRGELGTWCHAKECIRIALFVRPCRTRVQWAHNVGMQDEPQLIVMQDDQQLTVTPKEFFEDVAPEKAVRVAGGSYSAQFSFYARLPEIELYCETESCSGNRIFATQGTPQLSAASASLMFITYVCKNCGKSIKTYALRSHFMGADRENPCWFKFGERPRFGPPVSRRLNALIEPERELFLKGRRCEMQGLGIGAFSYYRRMVEGLKNRLLDKIISVCKRLPSSDGIVQELEKAKAEFQFSKAIEGVHEAIPQVLLINGHANPLTLLHGALSAGIHNHTDDECLAMATDIRVVLTELAERLANALKDDKEVTSAVSRLLNRGSRPIPALPASTSGPSSVKAGGDPNTGE